MLYAEDTMLLLGDTTHYLEIALSTIARFGDFSGLRINGDKSTLMLLDYSLAQIIAPSCPVPVTSSFKYLGIQVTPHPVDFCRLNITPLLSRFSDKTKVWNGLWLSLAFKVNLVKKFFMPQLL